MPVDKLAAWQELTRQAEEIKEVRIDELFDAEPQRLNYLSGEVDGLYGDLSKSLVSKQIFTLLIELAEQCHLSEAIVALFRGDTVNRTENRPALHTLLREPLATGETAH